ncbi:MAG: branched-chain amino acid transport system ATP-binding protein [Solirubrobacteraceae bacterium]|nr:branched-chain amino acid transport system ATP-binding protein [Solirubrobacteraceae bacterium]
MLEVRDLRAGYAAGEVLHGLTFSVPPGSIVSLVGANGAGKSTTLKAVSGLLPPREGSIVVDGRTLPGGSAQVAVKAGLAHVPEGRQVFSNMSVADNLSLGSYATRRVGEPVPRRLESVLELFPELAGRLNEYAGSLSGGQQQMLAIGRSLMARPTLLLLDEPSLGLAPIVVDPIFELLKRLRGEGTTNLLVEQNVHRALEIADRAYVLASGRVESEGAAAMLRASAEIEKAYLGIGVSE